MINNFSRGTLPIRAPSNTAPILAKTSVSFSAPEYLPAKTKIDRRSSATASANRKLFNSTLTRFPSASNTNITKAISVGITSGQPFEIAGSEVMDRKITAGNTIPPKAAKLGSKICLMWVVSFRSCIPIKKKNGANTSL